jgi:hypothetical protein
VETGRAGDGDRVSEGALVEGDELVLGDELAAVAAEFDDIAADKTASVGFGG